MVDNLGPALFSTPDIIRRVGSNSDSKVQENVVTSLISTTSSTVVVSSGSANSLAHLSSTPSPSTSSITSNRASLYIYIFVYILKNLYMFKLSFKIYNQRCYFYVFRPNYKF